MARDSLFPALAAQQLPSTILVTATFSFGVQEDALAQNFILRSANLDTHAQHLCGRPRPNAC